MKRIAAIDIGSNSVRSIIVEVSARGPYRLLDDERSQTRLGEGLALRQSLSAEAMARTSDAIARMAALARQFEVDEIRAIATSAVREARNGRTFLGRVKREVGLDVEVISAEEEGRLAYVAAAAHFDLGARAVVVDLGGGSLEVVHGTRDTIESIRSLPLGSVVLTERFLTQDPVPPKVFKAFRRYVRDSLEGLFGPRPDAARLLVGSGGTIGTIAWMAAAHRGLKFETVHGQDIERADVVHLTAQLKRQTIDERQATPGLPPQRADIILAGIVVVDEVMRLFDANEMRVNAKGVREGIILDTLAAVRRTGGRRSRMQGVLDFAKRCRFDRPHSMHVVFLALSLFDQLSGGLPLAKDERPLLEAAVILHDVGYYISYAQHHKHSYHLISYADLPGFSPREREIIAAVARYHRGALPKARHESLSRLAAADRDIVERLGALLRLADGLDRGRGGRVKSVGARIEDGRLVVTVSGTENLDVEVYGGRDKGDLFERAFGLPVEVTVGELIAQAEEPPSEQAR